MQQIKKLFFWLQWFLLILLAFEWPWSVGRVKKNIQKVFMLKKGNQP